MYVSMDVNCFSCIIVCVLFELDAKHCSSKKTMRGASFKSECGFTYIRVLVNNVLCWG